MMIVNLLFQIVLEIHFKIGNAKRKVLVLLKTGVVM